MKKLSILTLLLIQGCTSIPNRPDSTTSTVPLNEQELAGIRAKIDKIKAGQFGEFVSEIHYAGEELEKAQSFAAGKGEFNVIESSVAADKALAHRNKAEAAFDALFQMNTGGSSTDTRDFEQRLHYLESMHVPRNLKIPVTNVYFSFGGHQVKTAERKKVKETIDFLRNYPVFALKLVGYADTVGNRERNVLLAERRNSAVIQELRKQGLPTSTVVSVAFGEANGPDETKNRENRRVEIVPYVHGDYNYPKKKKSVK